MKRSIVVATAVMAALLLSATAAMAANPHFVGTPTFADLGTTLRASGSIAGLGNENIDVVVTATGTASVECINPGGNRAPGQDTSVTSSGSVTDLQVKNGRANFVVTTAAPTVTGAEACPNPKWMAVVTDVDFTSVRIQVFQPAGSTILVLDQTFTL